MNSRLELTEDRLDDLESHIIQLTQDVNEQKKTRQKKNLIFLSRFTANVMVIPIIIATLVLLGLDVNYQSENKTFSYNSKGLIEVTLLLVSTFSGGYAANKYRNEHADE